MGVTELYSVLSVLRAAGGEITQDDCYSVLASSRWKPLQGFFRKFISPTMETYLAAS